MSDTPRPRRAYRSAIREAQASQTRTQILEAAHKLFIEKGYAGTSMQAIAVQAGVGMQTIYAIFKNKPRLLVAVFNAVSAPPGEENIPVPQRAAPRKVARERDQRKQLQMFAQVVSDNLQGAGPVSEIMVTAARTEPEISRVLQVLNAARLRHTTLFVEQLRGNGPLRAGLDAEMARDIVWTLTSPEVFLLMTRERGWSKKQYAGWLGGTLIYALLDRG
jgi:AcrR family transcriptional regulator